VSSWALVVATVGLGAITFWYAWQTRSLVRTTKAQADALTAAHIVVRVVVEGVYLLNLVLTNDGRSAAKDVSFSCNADISVQSQSGFRTVRLRDVPLFKNGISYMPPGTEFQFCLGPRFHILDEHSTYPRQFTLEVSHSEGRGRVTEDFFIDLDAFMETRADYNTAAAGLYGVQQAIEKLSR